MWGEVRGVGVEDEDAKGEKRRMQISIEVCVGFWS